MVIIENTYDWRHQQSLGCAVGEILLALMNVTRQQISSFFRPFNKLATNWTCLVCNCRWLAVCIVVVVLCGCCFLMCICCTMCALLFFTLDAGLLARSQYSEGPETGHLDTGFSWFPCT
jgi:hypothetical protein